LNATQLGPGDESISVKLIQQRLSNEDIIAIIFAIYVVVLFVYSFSSNAQKNVSVSE
jgi:di/tricarboxylate transporter